MISNKLVLNTLCMTNVVTSSEYLVPTYSTLVLLLRTFWQKCRLFDEF